MRRRPCTPPARGCSEPCPPTTPRPPRRGCEPPNRPWSRLGSHRRHVVGGIRELTELPRDQEADLLSDVDRVVADPLERASRQVHVQSPVERSWVLGELQGLEVRGTVQAIYGIVHLRQLQA